MASRHESTKSIPLPLDTIAPYIMSMNQRLSGYEFLGAWTMPDGSVLIRFSTDIGLTTWGEDIDITLYRDPTNTQCTAYIKSEATMPTQIIDFGRNKKVVQAIETDIDNIVAMFLGGFQGGAYQAPGAQ